MEPVNVNKKIKKVILLLQYWTLISVSEYISESDHMTGHSKVQLIFIKTYEYVLMVIELYREDG